MKKRCMAIVLSAGQGKRMGTSIQKQYIELCGKPIICYCLEAFEKSEIIDDVIMVVGAGQEDYVTEEIVNKYHFGKVRAVVSGGKERYDSVWNGLKAVRDGMAGEEAKEGYVYIHDGARPFVDEEIIKRAYTCVEENRACVAGMPSKDTVKIVDENQFAVNTPVRKYVWIVQTPQVFETALIRHAYFKLMENEENETMIFDENILSTITPEVADEENFEYEYYYSEIKKIERDKSENEIDKIINENLPSLENPNYDKIINRIKSEILSEIIELNNLLLLSGDDIKLQEEIKEMINVEKFKFSIINKGIESKDIKKEKINNNLVFLKTESDNTYCLRDLNGIKREYYKSFKDLLMSIKNGTFKNVKRLTTTNSKLNSISEVRGFKTRVIFDRIDSKTYIILMCAVKKSDFDLGYQNLLEGRCLKYRCFKNTIFEKKDEDEFIKENMKIEEQLFLKLSNK